ncbi:MAG TPA: SurA N-terminal domain-containing protein [Thermoanaerobaculia bacterium]|nr:SurA N-terminal domain-containing protein [Thermoanaerobaculia bacterium]
MRKLLILLALFVSPAAIEAAQVVEAIVARVGDRIITRSQYLERLNRELVEIDENVPPAGRDQQKARVRAGLLEEMIDELLIRERAENLGIRVTDEQLGEAIARLKQQYGITTDEQFETSLAQSGLTRPQMENRLRETLLTQQLFARELRARSQVDDRELRRRYEREKENYRLPERAKVREIVLTTPPDGDQTALQATAEEIAQRARAGEDFLALVASYSEAPSKEDQGDLGIVARGELLAPLDDGIFKSDASAITGSVVGPVLTRFGYHILNIEQRMPAEIPPFEDVKERLREEESEQTFQRDLRAYLDNLRKSSFVKVNQDVLPQG